MTTRFQGSWRPLLTKPGPTPGTVFKSTIKTRSYSGDFLKTWFQCCFSNSHHHLPFRSASQQSYMTTSSSLATVFHLHSSSLRKHCLRSQRSYTTTSSSLATVFQSVNKTRSYSGDCFTTAFYFTTVSIFLSISSVLPIMDSPNSTHPPSPIKICSNFITNVLSSSKLHTHLRASSPI